MNNQADNVSGSNSPIANRFDQKFTVQVVVFLAIVLIGIASRFWLVEMPNFKPVAALVLFGAFFFRRSWVAVAALVVVMLLSDLKLGVYDWKLTACVYLGLGLAGGLGVWIKRSIESSSQRRMGWKQIGRFGAASIVMSTSFFVLTNGAVWWMGQWHPETWSGLVGCYAAGLPFYRATLMGDLFFTGVLVGGYCAVEALQMHFVSSPSKVLSRMT